MCLCPGSAMLIVGWVTVGVSDAALIVTPVAEVPVVPAVPVNVTFVVFSYVWVCAPLTVIFGVDTVPPAVASDMLIGAASLTEVTS